MQLILEKKGQYLKYYENNKRSHKLSQVTLVPINGIELEVFETGKENSGTQSMYCYN